MRHLLILLVALLAGYGLWQLAGRATFKRLTRHLLRVAALALVLLALLVLAYQTTAIKLL
ncbi:hypothetical protein HNQ51_002008 [Inhella inkyongensis]|uniref:Uncharacterized protein n=1 Tax=Inhella inkyongensis TaxID=392593 RepID=A0A840S7D9_9BURK|nr:hypothetical protein [Inhella inkyongensis]MBB5204694.1 hypothetical protein [Inhella inkyongensis]